MKKILFTAAVSMLLSVTGFCKVPPPPVIIIRNPTRIVNVTNVQQEFINQEPSTYQAPDPGPQSSPDAPQPAPVQYYEIVSVQSGKGLAVQGGPDAVQVHSAIQQRQFAGTDDQIWRLVPTGDGYFEIFSKDTDLCLDVPWGSLENSQRIQLCNVLGGDNQRWSIVPAGNGSVLIVGKRSGKCLNVAWGSMDNGADIVQYNCDYSPNEKWILIPLAGPSMFTGN
jgi:hypothetical protein